MTNQYRRRTEITIETQSLTKLRMLGNTQKEFVFCPHCRTKTATFIEALTTLVFRVEPEFITVWEDLDEVNFSANEK